MINKERRQTPIKLKVTHTMKSILDREAKEQFTTVNKIVVDLIEKEYGCKYEKTKPHNMKQSDILKELGLEKLIR